MLAFGGLMSGLGFILLAGDFDPRLDFPYGHGR